MSDSLRPHGLQHVRFPCPTPTPGVYSNSCPLSRWCHPTISSFVVPFFSCLQSFWASGSFQISQFFASGGQSIRVSASALIFPMNIHAFELWYWRRRSSFHWTEKRSNQSILKEIGPGFSLEGLMLRLKLQYFGHLMWRGDPFEKTLMLGKIEGGRRRGWQDEMVRWHHRLGGYEFG